jgi:gliding motility-associated-like protein
MKNIIVFNILFFLSFTFCQAQSPPVTQNDGYTTDEGTPLTVDVANGLLANDTDPDGDTLSIFGFIINGVVYNPGQTVPTVGGNVTVNVDGSFSFNPSAGFDGTVPLIAYIVTDGTLRSYANFNLSVTSPGPAVAQTDFDTADINTTLNVTAPGVLANDAFEDENTIQVISFTINGNTYNAGQTANTGVGSFTLFADGSYTFTPDGGYTGDVPEIFYTISGGTDFSTSSLFITVENVDDIIQLQQLSSCNQGFTPEGNYKIEYRFGFRNLSNARDYHSSSIINTIRIVKLLNDIYGSGCVIELENFSITTQPVDDYVGNSYPLDFDLNAVNQNFVQGNSSNVFTNPSVQNSALYPRQRVTISFCMIVDPFCDGRPNPTPSGSGVDFNAEISLTSSNSTEELISELPLEDFHTTEALLTAGFFIPENTPPVNPDGTFDFVNTVVITNEGSAVANNVNFNLGLGSFFDNGLSFSTLTVNQISGPAVNVNPNYDGDTNPLLLEPGNNLAPNETIVLEVFHLLNPVGSSDNNIFFQLNRSQTQGPLDGFDESTPENSRQYTFVMWEDNLGNHLDRYYGLGSSTDLPLNDQCSCILYNMSFNLSSSASSNKETTTIDETPDGVLEYELLSFQLTVTNTSPVVELKNLILQDDLSSICSVTPSFISDPEIIESTATQDPNLNPNFDGITDIDIFDGTSGILNTGESITVEITLQYDQDCAGENVLFFSGEDPLGNLATSTSSVNIDTAPDEDNDNVPNVIDIDDDNDTIPDLEETGGLDPLEDHDGDLIPNYRDPDFDLDENNDGIVDIFDFDSDGVPNHFDLDSDNDGILDIYEVNNQDLDTDDDGITNNPVGINGLDDTVESEDTENAQILYTIEDTDSDTLDNYLDIDADGDGIVDNIEAQPTDNYIPPESNILESGIDNAYVTGLIPVDTDEDGVFDYLDFNSDNDDREDDIEGWDFDSDGIADTSASGTDADNDGLDDGYDNDTSQVNPTNSQIPTDFPNADYDVTPERDWREPMAIVLSISDISTIEGNQLDFTISLGRYIDNSELMQSPEPTEMILSTSDGSDSSGEYNIAIAPYDYLEVNNETFIIPANTQSITFSVSTFDDIISELNEDLTLSADIISTNTVNSEAQGVGTILDNEPLPTISINDDIVPEGEDLIYNISLDIPSSSPVEINMLSSDVTAMANEDYTPISNSFTIPSTTDANSPNLTVAPFNVTTLVDNLNEADEEYLNLVGSVVTNNVTNPNFLGLGTILDIDPEPLVTISNDEVIEGNILEFTISLLNAENQPMTNYLPIDFELETLDITTTVNLDYDYFNEFDVIPAGESFLRIQIPTIDDNLNEDKEFMNLSATIISGSVSNMSNVLLGLGAIVDNDIPNLFTPNNDGQSDVFRITGLEEFPNFRLIIFDRWGGEIYNYSNNGNLSPQWWDGTKNGNPVIEGVYFYELDYNDGITKPKTGFIQLAR